MKQRLKRWLATASVLIFTWNFCLAPTVAALTVKEEEELSREFMRLVMRYYAVIEDPYIVEYINQLGHRILAAFPPQPFDFHFFVIKEDVYNAFAAPAGKIFINSGLFADLDSEAELAGILAHEISHVYCRHIADRLSRSKKTNWVSIAGLLAGILLGAAGAGAAAQAVTMGSMAAQQSMALSNSRQDEHQADQIGLPYLNAAGYSAEGLLDSLNKIRQKRWFGSDQIPDYLQTHPAPEERIANIDNWISVKEADQKNKLIAGRAPSEGEVTDFLRARTRIYTLYGDEALSLRYYQDAVKRKPDDLLANYGLGLALARNNQYQPAAAHIRIALEKNAFDPFLLQDLGRIYFLDGQYEEALSLFQVASGAKPLSLEGRFYRGRALLELGRFEEAEAILVGLTDRYPAYVPTYFFLGKTYDAQGKVADSHFALGRFYLMKGDLRNARTHLQRAMQQTDDPRLQAEIKKYMETIKKQKPDASKKGEK